MTRHRIAIVFFALVLGGCLAASVVPTCQTATCKKLAGNIHDYMDTSVKPCENFYNFACGKFLKNAVIKQGTSSVGTFESLGEGDDDLMEKLLALPVEHKSKCSFEEKMKKFFKACMNTDAIEKRGFEDYSRSDRDDWPTLNPRWTEATFDLQTVVEKYSQLFSFPLFSFDLSLDNNEDVRKQNLEVVEPEFMLYEKELLEARDSEQFKGYERYYTEMAVTLGAERMTAEFDAKKVIDLIRNLAQYFMDTSLRREPTVIINPNTLQGMNKQYPYIDWVKLVQKMYRVINPDIDISESQSVNIKSKDYLAGLDTVLKSTDKRTIQNLFAFNYAVTVAGDASKTMRDIFYKFKEDNHVTRGRECLWKVDDLYNRGLGKLLSRTRLSPKAKTFMDKLIRNLRTAFNETITELDWMGDSTKRAAFKKVNAVIAQVGIPDSKFGNKDLDLFYKSYEIESDQTFIKDFLQHSRQLMKMKLSLINKPLEHWRWSKSMTYVGAYHLFDKNTIVFPLGILQPPLFDQTNPSYMNYGGIGFGIGHEIGHAFDNSGRHYDEHGRYRDWWTASDEQKYTKKANCYVDQYSQLVDEQVNIRINGALSETENIADNMAIREAFKAYKDYEASHPAELPLPKLGLTNDQLFFLATAHSFCGKSSDNLLKRMLTDTAFVSKKFRVNTVMQNSEDFAKAFDCQKGDFMNPVKKCSIL